MPSALRPLTTGQRRRLLALAFVAAGVFFALALLAQLGVAIEAEWRVQRVAQAARTDALEGPMRAISALGTGWVLLPSAVTGALALCARHRRLALFLVVTGVGAASAANLAKLLAIRQRPNSVLWSYPSAHTFGMVVFVIVLLYVLWGLDAPPWLRSLVLTAGLAAVVAVGISRLYLNAHWIGDVLGGVTGGLAFALGAVLALDRGARAAPTIRPAASRVGVVAG